MKWVPWVAALLCLYGVVALALVRPGWAVASALVAYQTLWMLLALRWRTAALQWRTLAERTLAEGFSEALVKANPGLLNLGLDKPKPSDLLEGAMKDAMSTDPEKL